MYTTLLGDPNTTNTLLKHKADVNTQKYSNGATALIYACNTPMDNKATPLFIASQNGYSPVVNFFKKK